MKATGQSSLVGALVGVAAVGALGAGFLLFASQREKAPARTAAPAARAEPRPTRAEAVQPRERARSAPDTVVAALSTAAPAVAAPVADAPEPTDEERAAENEARFVADGERTRAANARELGLRRAFSAPEVAALGELKNIECRASQCRLEVSFARAGADIKVVERLFASHDAPYPAGGTIASRTVEADGKISATVFLRAPTPAGWSD